MAAGNIEDFRKKIYLLIKIIYFGYSGVYKVKTAKQSNCLVAKILHTGYCEC